MLTPSAPCFSAGTSMLPRGAEVPDFGRGDQVDVPEKNVERGRCLWKIDMWKLAGGVMGLRTGKHVAEYG